MPAWKFTPSMLYKYCEPMGAVTVMVPVATVHVGCDTLACGASGVALKVLAAKSCSEAVMDWEFLVSTRKKEKQVGRLSVQRSIAPSKNRLGAQLVLPSLPVNVK